MRTVRIFVSSPNDALDERRRVSRVVERLNGAFRDSVHLEAVRWEERFYSAHDGFQPQIPRSGECDLVLAVLRGRLGSPLSQAFHAALPPEERLPDGAAYPSGTAYEILSAIRQRQRGGELPDIYVFRWPEPPQVSLDAPDRAEIEAQWQALKRFAEAVFLTPEGHFKGAYQSYRSLDDFEAQVEALLRDWLKAHVLGERTVLWPAERGSPFRGLEPFGMRHAEVFFGRTREVARAVGKLKQAAGHGAPFQLVVGPSGAGKSSFVRAGLVPKLIAPGEVEGVGAWRVALMRPGESPEGPATALARRLFESSTELDPAEAGRPAALPELRAGAFATPEALARLLAHADDTGAAPIRAALAQVTAAEQEKWGAERPLPARLLLVVDQLDEIFATAITDEQRAGFGRLLEALGRTGAVWVVATLRAEFYEAFLKSPLAVLAGDERTFTLKPPGLAEMAEIVREPARAADLVWEGAPETGERLDERLLADIDRPDLLPLLQFVLDRLYEKREGGNGEPLRLTFAAYRALGTLDGALDTAGRQALAKLGTAEQARLPRLLRALVTPAAATGNSASLALQSVPLARAAPDEASRRLAGALVDARLLVTSVDKQGEPLISLAHQRVIEAWEQARAIIASSADFYRVQGDITAQRSRWESGRRRGELLIPRGVSLAEAEQLTKDHPDELPGDDIAFVRASRRRANRAVTLFASLATVFAIVAVFAAIAGWIASQARREAIASKKIAIEKREEADHQRRLTEINQSAALSALSSAILQNSPAQSAKLALAAWPRNRDDTNPKLDVSLAALGAATLELRERRTYLGNAKFSPDGQRIISTQGGNSAIVFDTLTQKQISKLEGHKDKIIKSAFSPDGSHILTVAWDDTARIWDAESGKDLIQLGDENDGVTNAYFYPDGDRVFISSRKGIGQIWQISAAKIIGTFIGHTDRINQVIFSPSGDYVFTKSADGTARIWNSSTGQLIALFGTDRSGSSHNIKDISFSNDGNFFVTTSRSNTASVWSLPHGELATELKGHSDLVRGGVFSPDSKRVLTFSDDGTVRAWSPTDGEQIFVLEGHSDAVQSASFSQSGALILTVSSDRTVRIWNGADGRKISVISGFRDSITTAVFSNDGQRVLTTSEDHIASIWSAKTGKELARLTGHKGNVTDGTFSQDGNFVLTSGADETSRLWDTNTGQSLRVLKGHQKYLTHARFSNDSANVLTTSADNTARIWNTKTGNLRAILVGHAKSVRDGLFSPDSRRLITASYDETRRLWDTETGNCLTVIERHGNNWISTAFSSDSRRLIVTTGSNDAEIIDALTGRSIAVLAGHTAWVHGATFSPDGTLALTSSDDHSARIWDAKSGQLLAVLAGHSDQVRSATFSPNGRAIATTSSDHTARIWDSSNGKLLSELLGHNDVVWRAEFSPDGTRLTTISSDNTARLWDVKSGKNIGVLRGHKSVLTAATFSSDSSKIITAAADHTAHLWSAATGDLISSLQDRFNRVDTALFSPDGKHIVTTQWGGNIGQIWNSNSGHVTATLEGYSGVVTSSTGHSQYLASAEFSPDSSRILTSSHDDTARLWDVATGRLLVIFKGHTDKIAHALFSPDGNWIVTASADRTGRIWDLRSIPSGNLFRVACGWLPDRRLSDLTDEYRLSVLKPICEDVEPLQ